MNDFSSSILSTAALLFFLMDPLGNVPILLSLLKDTEPKRLRRIIFREMIFALALLLLFLFTGEKLLNFLHLQQESVSIAGGIILLTIGFRLIFPKPEGLLGNGEHSDPFIVPIAIPMIAGPSVLAMIILMTKSDPTQMGTWLSAVLIAWGLTSSILLMAPFLYRILGSRGLKAVERLMGMILLMMSVQMLINGIRGLLI